MLVRYPQTIISGGQTGVDRAALDWAIVHEIPHGGWCPSGRIAADGVLADKYLLRETESQGYRQRTRRNVIDSDGTLIVNRDALGGGSLLTLDLTRKSSKPCKLIQLDEIDISEQITQFRNWLISECILTLNIAGPSEGRCPGIYSQTFALLSAIQIPLLIQPD